MGSSILFASGNKGKLAEVRAAAARYNISVLSPEEFQAEKKLSPPPDVEERGNTFLENAELKAKAYSKWAGGRIPVLADDSGLEVEALNGAPGIHTARYAGEKATSAENIAKLLSALRESKERKARFFCALYLEREGEEGVLIEEELRGSIAEKGEGSGGFGYDPVFIPEGRSQTLSQIKERETDFPTHRTKALSALFGILPGGVSS